MTIADRSKYKGVKADWHDKKAAKRETCQAGGGEPWYKLRRHFPNRETAQKAAEAKFKKLKRGEGGLDLAMPGEPRITAETRLALAGFREGIDGDWLVKSVTHAIGNNGFITGVRGERPNEQKGAS